MSVDGRIIVQIFMAFGGELEQFLQESLSYAAAFRLPARRSRFAEASGEKESRRVRASAHPIFCIISNSCVSRLEGDTNVWPPLKARSTLNSSEPKRRHRVYTSEVWKNRPETNGPQTTPSGVLCFGALEEELTPNYDIGYFEALEELTQNDIGFEVPTPEDFGARKTARNPPQGILHQSGHLAITRGRRT